MATKPGTRYYGDLITTQPPGSEWSDPTAPRVVVSRSVPTLPPHVVANVATNATSSLTSGDR